MFHVVAYESNATLNVETDLTPIPDGLMVIQNGHFLPQVDMKLLFACAMALHVTLARIITPSMRQITTPFIRPLQPTLAGGDLTGIADYSMNPFTIKGLEELQVDATVTTTEHVSAILGLSRTQIMPAPQGNIFVMRGTAATTLAANVWTQGAMTWNDSLPAGQYVCVGLEAFGATLRSARLTFENQWERPGCVACATAVQKPSRIFQRGYLGVWGNFSSFRMPTVEFFADAADTAQEVYLHLIRVG